MSIGTRSDWATATHLPQGLIYPELAHTALSETLVQVTDAFNAASRGAIRLVTKRSRGDYTQESFFKSISNLVSRRDVNSSSSANALVVPMGEHISIKLNRKIGPVDQTLDSFKKLGSDDAVQALSVVLGDQIAKAMAVDQLDCALRAATAAIAGQSTNFVDKSIGASPTAGATLTTKFLVDALAKMGDQANRVVAWVMHSKPYFDLINYQINPTNNGDVVANSIVMAASPATLNRPVIVTDSAGLTFVDTNPSPNSTAYYTLGLVDGGVTCEDSEEEFLYTDIITGLENVVARVQGEFAYNLRVHGFKFNLGTSPMAINPTNAQVATSSNWTKTATSYKDLAGVCIATR